MSDGMSITDADAHGLPLRMINVLRRTAKFPPDMAHAMNRASRGERGVFIHGPVGTGKTVALVAVAVRVRQRAAEMTAEWSAAVDAAEPRARLPKRPRTPRLRYFSDREFIAAAREAMHDGRSQRFAEGLTHPDVVLCLDDVGSGTGDPYTDFEVGLINDIVDRAYESTQALAMTSNLDLAGIARILGDRCSSRLVEACEVINLKGADRRVKGATT